MGTDLVKIRQLLEEEIQSVTDDQLRADVRSILVGPTAIKCAWDYGEAGETYPGWKVAEQQRLGIVYCDYGFGPSSPWGLIWLDEAVPSMGQDSGWSPTFREAVADLLDIPPASLNVR